jgi:hypothetical protein
MKDTRLPERIAQLAEITRMERGHLSVIRTGPDGQPYFNLQHRKDGKNVTEYIPRDQVPVVQEHLAAYQVFQQLIDEHLNEVSEISRQERKADTKKKRQIPSAMPSPKKRKSKNS